MAEAALALANSVHERKCASDWLQLVEDEWGYLMAMSRAISEQRKAKREGLEASCIK